MYWAFRRCHHKSVSAIRSRHVQKALATRIARIAAGNVNNPRKALRNQFSCRAARQGNWLRRAFREIGRATSELQSPVHLVCRLLLEKKKEKNNSNMRRYT